MATAIFWPTQPTYQRRPIVNLFNFGFFHPILIRFGLGDNFGLKRTWNKFEITKALWRPKADLRRALCRLKAGPRTALFSRIYIYISLFILLYTQEVSQNTLKVSWGSICFTISLLYNSCSAKELQPLELVILKLLIVSCDWLILFVLLSMEIIQNYIVNSCYLFFNNFKDTGV